MDMVQTITLCNCDLCGKEMRSNQTGAMHWQAYLVLGDNIDENNTKRYDDVCPDCVRDILAAVNACKTRYQQAIPVDPRKKK